MESKLMRLKPASTQIRGTRFYALDDWKPTMHLWSNVSGNKLGPMRSQPRRILITAEDLTNSFDAELIRHVFGEANRLLDGERAYSVEIIATAQSREDETCRYGIEIEDHRDSYTIALDTVVVTGSYETRLCKPQPKYLEWLRVQCSRSRRIVSVAGGAIFLGAIGLLKGRKVVSHWNLHQHTESNCPGTSVRSDILYAQDGNIYTCAGWLASVDLALRLVEDDLGSAVAMQVARRMLLPFRRTAACSQLSCTLQAQDSLSLSISNLLAWLPDHLTSDLSVSKLARRVAMSPRNFARQFRAQVEITPARYIENMRFEAAKRELIREGQSLSGAAQLSGFKNAESLRRLFQRRLGVSPKAFRDQTMSFAVPPPPWLASVESAYS
jgi:transcriptional regulator GlxA family with amidase domain